MAARSFPKMALTVAVAAVLAASCSSSKKSGSATTTTAPGGATTTAAGGDAGPALRTPPFGEPGKVAPIVKVVPSLDPTVVIQFPLVPAEALKAKFPKAAAQVTVVQGDPEGSDSDIVHVTVSDMPPNTKFTVFFTELADKPFGHAEYVGDLLTTSEGTGESVFHVIALVAFAADNRTPGTSGDQTGDASGVQLEHVGMWFDALDSAKQVLQDDTLTGTPFDGGSPPLHAGPQALTDAQTLPVL